MMGMIFVGILVIIGIPYLLIQTDIIDHNRELLLYNTYGIRVGVGGWVPTHYTKDYRITNGIISFVDLDGNFFQFENKSIYITPKNK